MNECKTEESDQSCEPHLIMSCEPTHPEPYNNTLRTNSLDLTIKATRGDARIDNNDSVVSNPFLFERVVRSLRCCACVSCLRRIARMFASGFETEKEQSKASDCLEETKINQGYEIETKIKL